MRYPILSEAATSDVLVALVAGGDNLVDARVSWIGTGGDLDLEPLSVVCEQFEQELLAGTLPTDWEPFEGRLAAAIHSALVELPIPVLDDHRFWAYLALRYFWWYVPRREATPIANGHGETYVANRSMDSIPIRLFLRAQASVYDGDYSPSYALERSTDFWRSHVIRVRTGSAPVLTRAFVGLQERVKMPTNSVLRPFARRLNRAWSNIALQLYDAHHAESLVHEMYRATILPPPTGSAVPMDGEQA